MSARIVLAEDESDIRKLLSFTLRRRGHTVLEANNSEQALALIRNEKPDLAVCDVSMPGLTGFDLLRALKQEPATSHIPIVLISANGQRSDIDRGLENGAYAYLVKPFAPHALADLVQEVISSQDGSAAGALSPESTEPSPEVRQPATVRPSAQGEGVRVVVADDDPDINRLVRTRLQARGFDTRSAVNGREVMTLLGDWPADLIFLDVSMPQMGGLEVLQALTAFAVRPLTIIMTAFGSEQVAIEALRLGATDYLRKPFTTLEFETVLDRTASRVRLDRELARLRRELDDRTRQLERELERAGQMQLDLLPRQQPNLAGFQLAARCIPARQVGGDFYDWQEIGDNRLTLVLGDVMGKGMSAALLMATVRASLRAVVRGTLPDGAMRYVVPALEDDLSRTDGFVTFFLAQLDARTRTLSYVDAGHGHAFIRRAGGDVTLLPPHNLPVGVMAEASYVGGSVQLSAGDALVLYSDGVIDAEPDAQLTPHALAARLADDRSAEDMVNRLCTIASVSPGSLEDDLTALVLLCTE